MDAIVVGIDVSKDRLDVHVRPAGTVLSHSRDAGGVEALIGVLGGLAPQLIAVEATGGFETVVVASLAAAGLPVVVVNPAQVRAFATALGLPTPAATIEEAHKNLMLTKALDLSAKLKQPVKLPLEV